MLRRPLGGETPRGRRGATRPTGRWTRWGRGHDVALVDLAERQVGMRQHHQGDMAVEPGPAAPLVCIEAQFALGILVEALDDPPHVGQLEQVA